MASGVQEQIFDSYSCQLCENVDTMAMVQCDNCNQWFHYDCVGVSNSVANRDWSCKHCIQLQDDIQEFEAGQDSPKVPDAFTYVSSKTSTRRSMTGPKTPDAFTYVSSKTSTRRSMTARQKAVALERLDEEEAIKLDTLKRKYRILELSESDKDEVNLDDVRASMDYTLHWAKENIMKGFNKMSFRDDVSISLSDREREIINKISAQDLRKDIAYKSAASIEPGFENALKRSMLVLEAVRQQQRSRHLKETDGQSKHETKAEAECGTKKIEFGDSENVYRIGDGKFVQVGNEFKAGAVPKIQRQIIPEYRQTYDPRKVLEPRDREVKFVTGPAEVQRHQPWSGDNMGLESTPIHRPKTSEMYDSYNLDNQGSRQPLGNLQLPVTTQPVMQRYDFGPSQLVQTRSGARTDSLQHGVQGSGYVGRNPMTPLTQTHIASRHVFKDLPEFHGRPEDWPIFLSALKNSTEACGYTDSENLGRLQKSLKGTAKDMVRSRLVHATSVPGVVETLHLLFGRSNLIIHRLLDEITKTPSPKEGDLSSLIKFAISVQNLCGTIESSGDLEYLQNPILIQTITDKLPTQTQLNWAYFKFGAGSANLSTLGRWLYQLAQVATDVVNPSSLKFNEKHSQDKDANGNRSKGWQTSHSNDQFVKPTAAKSSSSLSKKFKCHACGSESVHKLENCKKFKEMTSDDRWTMIKKFNICGSCFGDHHYFKCQNKKKCNKDGCNSNHHIMLHNTPKKVETPVSEVREVARTNSHRSKWSTTKFPDIFRIVPVFLSSDGQSIQIFAYMDDGSNLTSLEEKVADKIGATGTRSPLCVLWALGINEVESDSRQVSVQISGVFDGAEEFTLDHVRTVKKLALPSQTITKRWLNQYSYLDGIPITTYTQAVPQMIIGLQYSKLMVSLETIEGGWTQPIVCRTRLGWVVQGPNDQNLRNESKPKYGLNMCECQMDDNILHQMVKEFFSLESFGVKLTDVAVQSKELIRARQLLDSTITRRGDRFESALLWRNEEIQLPSSLSMALRRLECVESKMKRDPDLAERMCAYIADFIKKGYIRKLSSTEKQIVGPRTWYLPLFPVFNPKKPEKLRVVWDGAAKVNGQSLNSNLLVGPDLLVPLPDILMRFRQRKVGITGDIKEMFHQILVRETDQDSQRFLWRDGDSSVDPDTYVMNVMTFGSSCSPSIAQFVKNKNAMDFQDKYPRAVEAVTQSHYVDDLIESTHTPGEAIQLMNEVQFIHQHAGFELRSFNSNSPEVLTALNGGTQDGAKILDDKVNFTTERVLGMYWNTEADTFTYCLKFIKFNSQTAQFSPTKREVLRTVMSVFDPLGFLAHFVVYAKILLQEIWRCKVGWDEPLPPILRNKWIQWLDELPKVERVHIPRLYSKRMSPSPPTSIQLHLFVDASLEAFAAMAYFRVENESGVDSSLVMAKTRVAPIKPMSVPRLELQGGVLGTRLAGSIIKSHNDMQIDKTIIWCDSRTVLSWIKSDLRKYNQFVSFRVAEILDSDNIEWRWIPSSENVADEATKSKKIADVETSTRWYNGPEFLRNSDSNWSFELEQPEYETEEEVRPLYMLAHLEIPVSEFINFERFSNWQRLVRTMAYVRRFVYNLRAKVDVRRFGLFSSEELLMAEIFLYKKIQYDCYQEELVIVRLNETAPVNKQKEFPKTSTIRLCSAYMDDYGLMRMRGRIDAASISDTVKRPIILDRHHYATHLIVNFYHKKYKHQHHQTVLNEVKQTFWIPKLRVLLGMVRNNCQMCKNTAAIPRVPEMASLPKARVAVYTRPFTYVGIDYFGPILVVHGRGTVKRWGVLITCFTTRAIHLEIAHSLDTSSCIMAINNFICIRGQAREFYSDNGTNFHGADNVLRKELEEEFAKLDKDRIQEEFTTSEYSWTFNPPAAAHMGGVWERMVQSVKKCLDQSMTARYPTDEVLKNLFAEAANIVNSRPLTYVPLDSPDDEVLTPNHFLIGSSSGQKPAGDFGDSDLLRNNWRTVQTMADKFWNAFVLEYLPTIMQRSKWTRKVEPVQIDDVVLIVDENFKRNTWPKGVIVEVFKDKSEHVRSARVRTSLGTFLIRPVSKIVILDVRRDLNNQEQLEVNPSHSDSVDGVENVANCA